MRIGSRISGSMIEPFLLEFFLALFLEKNSKVFKRQYFFHLIYTCIFSQKPATMGEISRDCHPDLDPTRPNFGRDTRPQLKASKLIKQHWAQTIFGDCLSSDIDVLGIAYSFESSSLTFGAHVCLSLSISKQYNQNQQGQKYVLTNPIVISHYAFTI